MYDHGPYRNAFYVEGTPGRAESDAQKREVMERLLMEWQKCAHLRLGQFLCLLSDKSDPFYIEDYDLVREAEKKR